MTDAGKKVKQARKLSGLTQRELADHSGVSLSTIRKLEQEERSGARMETLHALAKALRLPTMALVETPHEHGPVSGTQELWAPVRAELKRPPAPEGEAGATPGGVEQVLAEAVSSYRSHHFAELAAVLPGLLRDADTLGSEGRGVRVRVLQLAAGALTHTRQFDIAELVVRRALEDAENRLESAASVNTLSWLLMRQGRLDEALSLATQWADEVEPRVSRATTAELSAWGLLLLRASGAAIRNNQPGVASDMLRLARSAATAIGREVRPGHENVRTFGPTTVRMRTVEDAVVHDRPDNALRLAERMPFYSIRPSISVRSRHGLDVANAYARLGQYTEAFGKLSEVQAGSPEWFPNQTPARDTLQAIVTGRRTLTPEMRSMAATLQLCV
ncbi:helix-turn-helix transcriptional regulator [Streptomyces sp. BE147]|uniref:helix-turn-helix domain-containing protein n=1 Tax=unclassified Streptomyces TaxID=2593676 RepID=UPI002E75C092|nr:helix-turn-helix transcriptional regulator [Streptomyces sp. BE147]MEE1737609.1 helix-turn-helix transcriptional regulator [Streptomyces sp. BE147]